MAPMADWWINNDAAWGAFGGSYQSLFFTIQWPNVLLPIVSGYAAAVIGHRVLTLVALASVVAGQLLSSVGTLLAVRTKAHFAWIIM